MANPQLTPDQRAQLFAPLFALVGQELERVSCGDPSIKWALNRKLWKELSYLERGKPSKRKALKRKKKKAQQNCAICGGPFTEGEEPELDRAEAPAGYTDGNTRLVHH